MSRHNIWLRHSRSSEDKPSWILFILFQEVATFSEFWRPWSLLAYRTSKSLLLSLFTKEIYNISTLLLSGNTDTLSKHLERHVVLVSSCCWSTFILSSVSPLPTTHTLTNLCPSLCCVTARARGRWSVYAARRWPRPGPGSRWSRRWWRTRTGLGSCATDETRCASGWCPCPANHRQTCVDICLCFKALVYLNGCISWNMLREETSVNVFCCNRLRHRLCSTTGGCCVPTELMASYQRLWSPPRPRVRAVTLFSLCRLPQSQTDWTCIIKAFRTHCGGLVQKPSNKSSFPADI